MASSSSRPVAGVPHAVWHAVGRDEQIAGGHRQFPSVEQEHAVALDDL